MSLVAFSQIVYNSIGVMTAVLYGMLAVWAVESHWHWFARAIALCAALLALLALPTYELAIQYGFAVAFFVAGFGHWNRRRRLSGVSDVEAPRRNWLQVGLRDVFLMTVVAAVVLAVVVHAPNRGVYGWLFTVIDSGVIAGTGLVCSGLALGRARRSVRIAAIPFAVTLNVLATYIWLLGLSPRMARFDVAGTRTLIEHFQLHWSQFWQSRWPASINELAVAVAIGTAAFVTWLVAARAADWLPRLQTSATLAKSTTDAFSRRSVIARRVAVLLTIAIAALPVYVWMRLIWPHPLPAAATASDQNYRELLERANEFYTTYGGRPDAWYGSDAQVAALIARDEPQWQRVQAVIARGCQFPWELNYASPDSFKFRLLSFLMSVRIAMGDGTNSTKPKINACLEAIRLAEMERRSGGPNSVFVMAENDAARELLNMRSRMSAQQCRELAQTLWRMDQQREPWTEFDKRSRRIMENGDWNTHLALIVSDLSGRSARKYAFDRGSVLVLRMLAIELAIRAYELEVGRLPATLVDLTPAYLPSLPEDIFQQGPPKYKLNGDSYLLYSVGTNGIDDGGAFATNARGELLADLPLDGILLPPTFVAPAPAAATSSNSK